MNPSALSIRSPDGTRIATASLNRTVTIWDITPRGYCGAVEAVAFSSDGKWLASIDIDATAIVWNSKTGDILYEITRGCRTQKSTRGFVYNSSYD